MILRNLIFYLKRRLFPVESLETAQLILAELIERGNPLMIARFGAVEIKALLYERSPLLFSFLKGYTYNHMENNAGFFPVNKTMLARYAEIMNSAIAELDVLASWRPEEWFYKHELKGCRKIPLGALGPIFSKASWSQVLKGKKVLVIHPFAKSIKRQYEFHRDKIFGEYSDFILPEFASLQVITAVQSIAGNTEGYETWFDALKQMESEIDKADFDVALIGCGAYGFPLAAYCKSIGKQGIHIGGSLQLYFGIKGKRWDRFGFYNEFWVSPDDSERPANLSKVEDGCYW